MGNEVNETSLVFNFYKPAVMLTLNNLTSLCFKKLCFQFLRPATVKNGILFKLRMNRCPGSTISKARLFKEAFKPPFDSES